MGLLNLFLQNQSNLDVNQIPSEGNGPVEPATGEFNTGVTPFQQIWDSNNTYINSFEGGTNVGIQPPTLIQTGLDVDNPNFVPSTTVPNTLTSYPATALGGLGQSAVQFLQIWNPIINYNDTVVGAGTSPLEQTLNETGLDNTDASATPTTVSPINPTNYPNQSTGEFGGVSNQYSSPYSPNSTYENDYINNVINFDTLQTATLDETGLDNTNFNNAPTTTTPYNPTNYPSQATGEFNGASTQYNTQYVPALTYENDYINNPDKFDTLQTTTLSETGLDNSDTNNAPTTTTFPASFVSFPPQLPPQTFMGEFNGAPNSYWTVYTPNFNQGYLDKYNVVISNAGNPQIQTIIWGQTGLDNTNPSTAPTTTIPPSPIPIPTSLPPQTFMGEFQGAPSAFSQTYTPNNGQGYLNNYNNIISNAGNPQINTLGQTGLDNTNSNTAPTTSTPTDPTQYPQFVQGEFNTAPNQYSQIWSPTNQYIINYLPNIQPNTVLNGETGLDNTTLLAFNTTFVPNAISSPTNYPSPPQTLMGEFGSAPSQFIPLYNPNPGQGYLDNYATIINNSGNPQIINLSNTGLDVEDQNAAPTTYVVPTTDDTSYPSNATGEYNGPALPYEQVYSSTPGFTYEDFVVNAVNGPSSTVENSLVYTGLDVENQDAAPTTYAVPTVDDTIYPFVEGATLPPKGGTTSTITPLSGPALVGSIPVPRNFKQTWKPMKTYYSFMIKNYEGQAK